LSAAAPTKTKEQEMLIEQNEAVLGQVNDGALIPAPLVMSEAEFVEAFRALSLEERREFVRCNCATH
jgi:hypothetical protein